MAAKKELKINVVYDQNPKPIPDEVLLQAFFGVRSFASFAEEARKGTYGDIFVDDN